MGKLIDGKPLAWWLYPPYPWTGRKRQRVLNWLFVPSVERPGRVVNEYGEFIELDGSDDYQTIRNYATSGQGGRTIYCSSSVEATKWWTRLLLASAVDKEAMVSYSPTSGFRGIRWKNHGNHRGSALILDTTWGRDQQGIEPHKWLHGIRRTLDYMGIGDYDTAGSFGEATLSKFWSESGHPREWRCGMEISGLLKQYTIGGRAEAPGARQWAYPSVWEIDLSHAYPTAVARGLPFGSPHFVDGRAWNTLPDARPLEEAVFGEWRITVHEDIEFSPIPMRNDWSIANSPLLWSLPKGAELTYAGWEDEMWCLNATGAVSIECLRAWVWPVLDAFLAPWVDDLFARREATKETDPFVSRMMKQVSVSAIGMWGLGDPQWEVRPTAEADLDADTPIEPDIPVDTGLTGLWLHKVAEEPRIARPLHWASYVRMAVRMELWRTLMREHSRGNKVLMSNFDALYLLHEPHTVTQGTNNMRVAAAQAIHPWNWKVVPHGKTIVPYNRAVIFPDEQVQRTPGATTKVDAMRLAVLVEHQRKRQEAGIPLFRN